MKPSSSMQCYRWRLVERSLTRLFCATNSESREETFQTASGPFQEFTKKIISRDTKLAVGRELTRSNLFPHPALRKEASKTVTFQA